MEKKNFGDQRNFGDRNNDRNKFDNRNEDRERTQKFEDRRGGMRGGQGGGRGGRGGGRGGQNAGGQDRQFQDSARDNRDNRNGPKSADLGSSKEGRGRNSREPRGTSNPIFVHGSSSGKGSEARSDRFVEDLFKDSKPPGASNDTRYIKRLIFCRIFVKYLFKCNLKIRIYYRKMQID